MAKPPLFSKTWSGPAPFPSTFSRDTHLESALLLACMETAVRRGVRADDPLALRGIGVLANSSEMAKAELLLLGNPALPLQPDTSVLDVGVLTGVDLSPQLLAALLELAASALSGCPQVGNLLDRLHANAGTVSLGQLSAACKALEEPCKDYLQQRALEASLGRSAAGQRRFLLLLPLLVTAQNCMLCPAGPCPSACTESKTTCCLRCSRRGGQRGRGGAAGGRRRRGCIRDGCLWRK